MSATIKEEPMNEDDYSTLPECMIKKEQVDDDYDDHNLENDYHNESSENYGLMVQNLPPVESGESDSGEIEIKEEPISTDEDENESDLATMCETLITEGESLLPEVRSENESKEGDHLCTICGKHFNRRKWLMRHLRIHNGEKKHECTICSKKFLNKRHLNVHLRTHTGEKPFECTICQKRFSQKVSMLKHLRVHTGEKPYECEHCGKRFSQQYDLVVHVRMHTGEKPFECGTCKKRYSHKSHYSIHLRTHTGEQPFECSICQRRFSHKQSLIRHLDIHVVKKEPANSAINVSNL